MKTNRELARLSSRIGATVWERCCPVIEPLESRVAPAAVFTFTDVDGDKVTVSSSKGSNTDLAAAATVVGGQLRVLNLTAPVFQGASVSITAVRGAFGGDGFVNVGYINAGGHDLGMVSVDGDLGAIDVGDGVSATSAVKSLTVGSLGRYGTSTGSPDINSDIDGRLGSLTIRADLHDAAINVTDSGGGGQARIGSMEVGGSVLAGAVNAGNRIGSVNIAHDLIGGVGAGTGILNAASVGTILVGGSVIGGTGGGGVITGGTIGSIHIGGDLLGGIGAASGVINAGTLGPVIIGGSMRGGMGANSAILTSGTVGPLRIGGDLAGGDGTSSGSISAGTLANLTIGGSLLGGLGNGSGSLSIGTTGAMKISRNVVGGDGDNSGILAAGTVASLTIGGSVVGGDGASAAHVSVGTIGPLRIGGDLLGGDGTGSGTISLGTGKGMSIGGSVIGGSGASGAMISAGTLGPVTIGRDLTGGDGPSSGFISCGTVKALTIGDSLLGGHGSASGGVSGGTLGVTKIGGNLAGSDGPNGGYLAGGTITSLTIGGSFIGGDASGSGTLSLGTVGPVKIGRDFIGGDGGAAGRLATGAMASLTIGGSVLGGTMTNTGEILATSIGPVKIGRDIKGGLGDFSGRLSASSVASLTLGGSLIGGSFSVGTHTDSGEIVGGTLGPVKIGHNIEGGSSTGFLTSVSRTGLIEADSIASLTVGGSITSGVFGLLCTLNDSGAVTAEHELGPVIIKGSLIGNPSRHVQITAGGELMPVGAIDLAMKSVRIGGSVEYADILAGYDATGAAVNANAQIGTVSVGGDWIASNLVAGARRGADGFFGTPDDDQIGGALPGLDPISRIASITIKGQVLGTPGSVGDTFGFVAEHIVAFKVGGTAVPLVAGPNSAADVKVIGPSFDVILRELL